MSFSFVQTRSHLLPLCQVKHHKSCLVFSCLAQTSCCSHRPISCINASDGPSLSGGFHHTPRWWIAAAPLASLCNGALFSYPVRDPVRSGWFLQADLPPRQEKGGRRNAQSRSRDDARGQDPWNECAGNLARGLKLDKFARVDDVPLMRFWGERSRSVT